MYIFSFFLNHANIRMWSMFLSSSRGLLDARGPVVLSSLYIRTCSRPAEHWVPCLCLSTLGLQMLLICDTTSPSCANTCFFWDSLGTSRPKEMNSFSRFQNQYPALRSTYRSVRQTSQIDANLTHLVHLVCRFGAQRSFRTVKCFKSSMCKYQRRQKSPSV